METVPVFWGNKVWVMEGQRLIPTTDLKTDDPNWINYERLGTQSSQSLSRANQTQVKFRKILHDQIISDILGSGTGCVEENPRCLLTHGGIASGKTSAIRLFLDLVADKRKYLHLDFDLIKNFLPEYTFMRARGMKEAAQFAQPESAKLAGRAFGKVFSQKMNVVYEGSLAKLDTMRQNIREMRKKSYTINVVSTFVTEEIGQQRATKRYEDGGRYVPPEFVRDTYLNCPATLVELSSLVDNLMLVDNRPENRPTQAILARSQKGLVIFEQHLYDEYLQIVGASRRIPT